MLRGSSGLAVLLCSAILLAALDAEAARFYRSVDANGNVSYSDRPSGASAEQFDVKVFTPEPVAAPPPSVTSKASAKEKPALSAEDEKVAQGELKTLQAKRTKNCAIAKKRLNTLQTVSRVYSVDEKGGRTYMTDEARVQGLANAHKAIADWCQK